MEGVKKAFISQPMKGKTNEQITQERQDLISTLEEQGYTVLDSVLTEKDVVRNTSLCYLAKSLEIMDEADIVVFMKGWDDAVGCILEHDAAVAYNKEIMEL